MKITGSLKIDTQTGQNFTWSFKAFKKWKKDFSKKFLELYGKNIKEIIPNGGNRELLYKKLLGMQNIDIFLSGNFCKNLEIDEEILKNCLNVANILNNKK